MRETISDYAGLVSDFAIFAAFAGVIAYGISHTHRNSTFAVMRWFTTGIYFAAAALFIALTNIAIANSTRQTVLAMALGFPIWIAGLVGAIKLAIRDLSYSVASLLLFVGLNLYAFLFFSLFRLDGF